MAMKVLFSWSGGKDSVLALNELKRFGDFDIVAFLTSFTEPFDRVSMHGVRRELLERQVSSLGFCLDKVFVPKNSSNEEYERRMTIVLDKYAAMGVSGAVFGDIFLEDLRKYRETNLSKANLSGIFPLWKKDTSELAGNFIDSGFKAVVVCVDSTVLGKHFAGREFDEKFLSELPGNVDPCGENGEFHTFVYDGPLFQQKVSFNRGMTVFKNKRFYFCDLLPA